MTRQSEGRFQCFPRFKSPAVLSCWNYRWSVSIIREKMSANLAEPDNKSVGRSLRDSGCLGHRRRTGEAHTAASETRPIFGAEGKRCSCLGLGAWVLFGSILGVLQKSCVAQAGAEDLAAEA